MVIRKYRNHIIITADKQGATNGRIVERRYARFVTQLNVILRDTSIKPLPTPFPCLQSRINQGKFTLYRVTSRRVFP